MFLSGDKVKLKDSLLLDNKVKANWYHAQPPDAIYTIKYDKRYKNSNIIFSFREDKSNPKWLFLAKDLILVKRPWYNQVRNKIKIFFDKY